jgi:hypothetical protein
MLSSSIQISSTTLTSQSRIFMASKNSRRELPPTLNSAQQRKAFSCALMLLREVLTSPRLTGSFSMTLPMILRNTSTELVELPGELMEKERHYCSCWNMSWDS